MPTIIEPTQQQLSDMVQPYLNTQPEGLGFAIGFASPQFGDKMYTFGKVANQRGEHMALDGDTLFELASISKTFTATLFAYLLTKQTNQNLVLGDFPLDIGKQFADIPLLSLANYTSGFPADNIHWRAIPPQLPQPYTVPGMLGYLKFTAMKPIGTGQRYTYSNLAFSLLGKPERPAATSSGD